MPDTFEEVREDFSEEVSLRESHLFHRPVDVNQSHSIVEIIGPDFEQFTVRVGFDEPWLSIPERKCIVTDTFSGFRSAESTGKSWT